MLYPPPSNPAALHFMVGFITACLTGFIFYVLMQLITFLNNISEYKEWKRQRDRS